MLRHGSLTNSIIEDSIENRKTRSKSRLEHTTQTLIERSQSDEELDAVQKQMENRRQPALPYDDDVYD